LSALLSVSMFKMFKPMVNFWMAAKQQIQGTLNLIYHKSFRFFILENSVLECSWSEC